MAKKGQKVPKRAKKGDFSKISNMFKKNGHVTSEPLRWPNFIPSYRKNLRVVFEKTRYRWTNERMDKPDSIGPSGI